MGRCRHQVTNNLGSEECPCGCWDLGAQGDGKVWPEGRQLQAACIRVDYKAAPGLMASLVHEVKDQHGWLASPGGSITAGWQAGPVGEALAAFPDPGSCLHHEAQLTMMKATAHEQSCKLAITRATLTNHLVVIYQVTPRRRWTSCSRDLQRIAALSARSAACAISPCSPCTMIARRYDSRASGSGHWAGRPAAHALSASASHCRRTSLGGGVLGGRGDHLGEWGDHLFVAQSGPQHREPLRGLVAAVGQHEQALTVVRVDLAEILAQADELVGVVQCASEPDGAVLVRR